MKLLRKAKSFVVLWLTWTVAVVMLGTTSRAEESSILSGAIVNFVSGALDSSNVIDGNFKTMIISTYSSEASPGDESIEFGIKLSSEKRIVSAFVVNSVARVYYQTSWGNSALYAGNDSSHFSATLTKCSSDFHDTGFIALGESCIGKEVRIRR